MSFVFVSLSHELYLYSNKYISDTTIFCQLQTEEEANERGQREERGQRKKRNKREKEKG